MNIDTLDLNLLKVFDAVYREQNLSRAAQRLGMSQPGVSQSLNRLRQQTGDPLFVRQAHGVTPTAFTEAIAAPVRKALDGLSTVLNAQGSQNIRQTDRRLRVAMSDYSQSLVLAPLLRVLDEQAPNLELRVFPDTGFNLHDALNEGELDLVLGAIPPLNEHFRHEELYTEEFVCIARANHPLIRGQLSLEAYRELRHVGLTVRAAQSSKIDAACLAHGFQRQIKVVVPSFLAMPFLVAASDAIATLPRRLLRLVPHHLDLQILKPPVDLRTAILRIYWPERNHHDPVLLWLRKQLLTICQTI